MNKNYISVIPVLKENRVKQINELTEYVGEILPEYDSICKQIAYCIYDYIGFKSFKPVLLMGDYEFLKTPKMEIVFKNYCEYIDNVRKQEYFKKRKERRENGKEEIDPLQGNPKPTSAGYYAPWAFQDRWSKIFRRLTTLDIITHRYENICGLHMSFSYINENKIDDIKKEAFINFI